jgi:hypothetical protein
MKCFNYEPHFHPERLQAYLPLNKMIFVCGNGDICFSSFNERALMFDKIREYPDRTFLIQTKYPGSFLDYKIPSNVIFGTTIETNMTTKHISKAPVPEERFMELKELNHSRKFVTHEPIMSFDVDILLDWDKQIKPEIVWVGYANHLKKALFGEPLLRETKVFINGLREFCGDVRLKTIREPYSSKSKEKP